MLSVRLTKDPILINDDNFREYLKRIRKYQPISREEEVELLRRAKEGDDKAIDKLLKANLRFVVSVAKRFAASNPTTNINDLISAGNLGLYEAIISFKKEKIGQCKLISYAVFHITKRIREEIYNNFSIFKINNHNKTLITKAMNMMKYNSTLTYEDAINIVLKQHNISDKKKQDLRLAIQSLNTIPLSELLHYQKELDDYKYEDLAYDEKEFEKVLNSEAIKNFVHKIIDTCTELYPHKKICFEIVKLHIGIATKYPMTKKEISVHLGIGVDKVRDYYKEGIRIIRNFMLKNQELAKDAMTLLHNV
jgi:RNA polymerase primary sigma factor